MIKHYKDYIDIYRWKSICEYTYDGETVGKPIPEGLRLIYVPLEQLIYFFRQYEHEESRKFVIVSGNTDFAIVEQARHPVNADIAKRLNFADWPSISRLREYAQITFGPCCDKENCKIDDKYSVKMYALTASTFNNIPDCVSHWYTVNLDVILPRTTCIPFGLACWEDAEMIDNILQRPEVVKNRLAYANWTDYTDERARLRHTIKNYKIKEITLRERVMPKLEYFEEMREHYYVICPFGNGLDCFRNWEALYLDCVPFISRGQWAYNFPELFKFTTHNLLDIDRLVDEVNQVQLGYLKPNPDMLKFSYWEALIRESVRAIS